VGVAVLGWLLAGGFAAGLVLRVARTLGTPVVAGQRTSGTVELAVPTAYFWVAVAGLALGLVAVLLAVVTWARLRTPSDAVLHEVEEAYGAEVVREDPERRDQIARQWMRAQGLTMEAQQAFGWFLVLDGIIVVGGVVGYLLLGEHLVTGASFLVTVANAALTGFVLVLLWVGRQAYANPRFRRTVGITWDLGTFWPRAVHPLAPPCYAERAVPDLMGRLTMYAAQPDAPGKAVVLSCHSQGTVLGAAVLLQSDTAVSERASFLTYGCPLTRLYAPFFPAYFNDHALGRLGDYVAGGETPTPEDAGPAAGFWWRNFYRLSDPIGGPVFEALDPGRIDRPDGGLAAVDVLLLDPVFARSPGDPCFPRTFGHSDYFADRRFALTVRALRDAGPAVPSPTTAQVGMMPRPRLDGSSRRTSDTQPGHDATSG